MNGCNGAGQPQLFRYFGNRLSMTQAGPTSDGWVSQADWNRFNAATGAILTPWVRVKQSTGEFQLYNPDQGTWHTLQVRGQAGAEYLTISVGDTSSAQ